MSGKVDLEQIKQKVCLHDYIGRFADGKMRRTGNEQWQCLCPFHQEKTPSFTINDKKGVYHCFGCGASGDLFSFRMAMSGETFKDAVNGLAKEVGIAAEYVPEKEWTPVRKEKKPDSAAEKAENDALMRKTMAAREIWIDAVRGAGTVVEVYLRHGRNIPLPVVPKTLRYAKDCWHGASGAGHPAMVGCIQTVEGRFAGVHRTYLRRDGMSKATVEPNKMMLGKMRGNAIRLADPERVLGIAEGIETGLSVQCAAGLSVWVAGSQGNMGTVELPPMVKEVVLCVDALKIDAQDNQRQAHERLLTGAMATYRAQGRVVRTATPPPGKDFNDLLAM